MHSSQPSLLLSDRGFLFGDGIFTTVKIADGKIEFFKAHCERFQLHCRAMKIHPPTIQLAEVQRLIELNAAYAGIWRLKVIASAGCRPEGAKLRPVGCYAMLLEPEVPSDKTDCRLRTYPTSIASPYSALKTLACAVRFVLLDDAAQHGCDDAVMLCPEGFLTETAFANIFWRHENQLYSPAPSLPLLYGIALTHVKIAAKRMRWQWHDVKMSPARLPQDAQLFICNSMKGIVPVAMYDNVPFSRDPSFEEVLQKNYADCIDDFSAL